MNDVADRLALALLLTIRRAWCCQVSPRRWLVIAPAARGLWSAVIVRRSLDIVRGRWDMPRDEVMDGIRSLGLPAGLDFLPLGNRHRQEQESHT